MMNRFKEQRGNPIGPSKSYCFPKSDEKDEVDAPRNKQGTSIRYKNFDKRQDFKSIKTIIGEDVIHIQFWSRSEKITSNLTIQHIWGLLELSPDLGLELPGERDGELALFRDPAVRHAEDPPVTEEVCWG